MVLEVVLFLNVESMNTLNLGKLDTFIKSTLVHVNKLYELKNALTGVNNFFGGLKLHALLHWTSQIKNFGMSFSFDTTSMEEAMKVNAIQNYGNTSRRSKTFIIEMTRNLLRRNICNHLKVRIESNDENSSEGNMFLRRLVIQKNSRHNLSSMESDTYYERVVNLGKIIIQFNREKRIWEFESKKEKHSLHPFLNFSIVTDLIHKYCLDCDAKTKKAIEGFMNDPTSTKYGIQIEKGIKVVPSSSSGIEPFLVYATSHYVAERSNDFKDLLYTKRYDSVEVASVDGSPKYELIVCIITVLKYPKSKTKTEHLRHLLITVPYDIISLRLQTSVVPYTELKYVVNRSHYCVMNIRDIQDIDRPLCVLPKSIRESKDKSFDRFWGIDLKYVDRSVWYE